MEVVMADEITIIRFEGDGPFVLPPVGGAIKVCPTEGSDDLLLEWPLAPVPGRTQKIVQLPVSPAYAMALMLVLQQLQQEMNLPIPRGQVTRKRFQ